VSDTSRTTVAVALQPVRDSTLTLARCDVVGEQIRSDVRAPTRRDNELNVGDIKNDANIHAGVKYMRFMMDQ
jgi:hypothetical protein